MLEDHLYPCTGRPRGGPDPEGDLTAGMTDDVADPDGMDFLPDLLAALRAEGLGDRELVDQLRTLEKVTSAAAAAKIVLTAELDQQRIHSDARAGLPTARRGRGVAHEVALARRESPWLGRQHLILARVLPAHMPAAMGALRRGALNESEAMILVRETADLSDADKTCVDTALAQRYGRLSSKELTLATRRLVFTLDPSNAEERARRARERRNVTWHTDPDGMARITGRISAEAAITAIQSLREYADARRQMGDARTRDQLMADAFGDRVNQTLLGGTLTTHDHTNTGSGGNGGGDSPGRGRTVEIQLVMNAETLLTGAHDPAHLPGYGPLPAGLVRDLLADEDVTVFLRRLYANPDDDSLIAMDSRATLFRSGLRRLLFVRDGDTCRTPGCNAPPRHGDHVRRRAEGGTTNLDGGQGLCEDCNYTKEQPGWTHQTTSAWPQQHTVRITTPTGHVYESNAPPLPVHPSELTPAHDLDWATLDYPPLPDHEPAWAAGSGQLGLGYCSLRPQPL